MAYALPLNFISHDIFYTESRIVEQKFTDKLMEKYHDEIKLYIMSTDNGSLYGNYLFSKGSK